MNAGINTSGRIESSHKVKSPLLFEPNIMHLDSKTTIEDILNYKKTDIQSYLKSKGKKISGTKLELAKRAYETNKYDDVNIESVVNSDPNLADEKIVPIDSLKTGAGLLKYNYFQKYLTMMLKITYYTAVTGQKTTKRWSVIVNLSEVLTFLRKDTYTKL